jgi:hypothetical protein
MGEFLEKKKNLPSSLAFFKLLSGVNSKITMYQLEKWQYSSWEKDTRFYLLELCQDLFGNWIIKRTWGSAVKQDMATLQLNNLSRLSNRVAMVRKTNLPSQ